MSAKFRAPKDSCVEGFAVQVFPLPDGEVGVLIGSTGRLASVPATAPEYSSLTSAGERVQ